MNELINSGITLTAYERKEVEAFIAAKSKPVNPSHLNEWKCIAAARALSTTV